jgi:hypothetical protein
VIMGNPAKVAMPIPTSEVPMDRAPPPGA